MPYDPYDSDDLIVLEIPTDIEDEEDIDDSDISEGTFMDISPVCQKGKHSDILSKIQKNRTSQSSKRVKKVIKKPAVKHRKRRYQQGNKATTSTRRSTLTKSDDETESNLKIETSKAESDAETEAIIETDLSLDARTEFIDSEVGGVETDEIVEEAIYIKEEDETEPGVCKEKVFTELPSKYLLFDELIATIIGFDGDTPIVEFTSITRDELKQCIKKLPVECGICPAILSNAHIADHLKIHQNSETRRYTCIYCDNTHCNRNSAAAHSRRHLGIRPYACDICDNYFTTKNDLKLHYQRKHLEREFICEMCGKTYAQNTFLKRHIQSLHNGVRPHQCEYCPKSYQRKGNLKEHVDAVHMGVRKPLACRFCDAEFRDSHKLARHRKEEHLNKSHFQCTPCGVEFTDIQFFNAHKRSIQCRNNRLALKMDEIVGEDSQGNDEFSLKLEKEEEDQMQGAYICS